MKGVAKEIGYGFRSWTFVLALIPLLVVGPPVCVEAAGTFPPAGHDDFPSTILKPGETYYTKTIHKFSVK